MPPALLRMQRPATGRRETECVERAAPMVSEQELIERIRRGDLVSFKAVFERYYGGVHAFTRGVVDNGFHAEEITQNVFIRLWLKREALDPSRNFKAFLYTLARHEIADYFRSDRYDRRRLRLDLLHDAEHVQEQFAAAYDADRLRQLVLDEIDRMPAQRREVFRLSRIEGLTNDEIARRLRISETHCRRPSERGAQNVARQSREVRLLAHLLYPVAVVSAGRGRSRIVLPRAAALRVLAEE